MIKRIKSRFWSLFSANQVYFSYLFKHHWPLIIVQIVSVFFNGISTAFISQSTKLFVDGIFLNKSIISAMIPIIHMSIFVLLMNAFKYSSTIYVNYVIAKSIIVVKKHTAKRFSNLRLSFFDIPENKNIISRALKYTENGGPQLYNYFVGLLVNIIAIISILYVLSPFAWWIIVFLVIITIIKTLIEVKCSKMNYDFSKKHTLLNRKVSYFSGILFNVSQLMDINIFNAFDFFCKKYEFHQNSNINLSKDHQIKINTLQIIAVFSSVVQYFVLYSYIGFALLDGSVSFSEFTLFFTAVNSFSNVLVNFKNSITSFVPMALEAQNYMDFINISDDNKYYIDNVKYIKIDEVQKIEFKNVFFKYPQKRNYILEDVSFTIKRGEIVSLVGMNGVGKTTIIKLILGFYKPTSGIILINSIPINKLDLKHYWQLCGTLFQQFNIYSISALDNITFGHLDDEKNDELHRIIDAVNLKERFEKEKNGINTELSREFDENGTVLSGGESQKIAFARACFESKRNLLILDEPSSALDSKSENELFTYVYDIYMRNINNIVIFVSHRLSSSTKATKIIFVDRKKVLAIGPHKQLIKKCAEYNSLFSAQASKYLS